MTDERTRWVARPESPKGVALPQNCTLTTPIAKALGVPFALFQFAGGRMSAYAERTDETAIRPRARDHLAAGASMNFLSIALFSGAMLMAPSKDSINVEPGKQLPQSLKVKADGQSSTD